MSPRSTPAAYTIAELFKGEKMRVILASKSPRRQELLHVMGIDDFEVIPAAGDENDEGAEEPDLAVMNIAKHKALEIREKCGDDAVIIAADTLVYHDGKMLGKPGNEDEAREMLESLSGRRHSVFTGIAVIRGDETRTDCVKTDVYFREMTDEEITAYIKSGEPMDKAGAYGAQGLGSIFVEKIDGDFFNVMGLPLCRLYCMLDSIGYRLFR